MQGFFIFLGLLCVAMSIRDAGIRIKDALLGKDTDKKQGKNDTP